MFAKYFKSSLYLGGRFLWTRCIYQIWCLAVYDHRKRDAKCRKWCGFG